MALDKAIKFLNQVAFDENLRTKCYQYPTKQDLLNDLGFTELEFENAINLNLTRCQIQEEGDRLHELQQWFALL